VSEPTTPGRAAAPAPPERPASAGEEAFFAGAGPAARPPAAPPPSPAGVGGAPPLPPPPRRRESALLARSPTFAVLALLVSGWLLFELSGDVAYFFSSRDPIDLGGPGAYALDRARENRLVQVRGDLADAVGAKVSRTGQDRTVGRLAGTSLLVDRPGRGGPPIFEGRLLPAASRADYAEVVAAMRRRGAPLSDAWLVLRDGERPRERWLPVLGAALLTLLVAVNLRALLKFLTS
jgi:hypothetical protein